MKKIITVILDGLGISDNKEGNAVYHANMTNFNNLFNNYPHSLLEASGLKAGLPSDHFGNSEIGHTLIGAGRYIKQKDVIISEFLEKAYLENETINKMLLNKEKTYHIMGLCSDGMVHSNILHFLSLYDILVASGVKKIYFHLITDGKDTNASSAIKYIDKIKEVISINNVGEIATICGRFYAMDRDQNFDRTKIAYNLYTKGIGIYSEDIRDSLINSYENGINDENIRPTIFNKEGIVNDGDVVVWMNYRNDRSKQLVSAFVNPKFEGFPVLNMRNLELYTFFEIDSKIKTNNFIEFEEIKNPLGLYLADLGLTQCRISESEKIPHVTYFFDGGFEGKIENCKKVEVPSLKLMNYKDKPEMSAVGVTKQVVKAIESDTDFILVNFANPDIVGHTGDFEATVRACMAVDICLGKILEVADDNFYKVIVLSDHGNADKMLEENGSLCKTHSSALVPFIIKDNSISLEEKGALYNVAPTILNYMDIRIPDEMSSSDSLLKD